LTDNSRLALRNLSFINSYSILLYSSFFDDFRSDLGWNFSDSLTLLLMGVCIKLYGALLRKAAV